MKRGSKPIPEAVAQLQRQLEQFRSTEPARTKLPESLWQAAVELARQYGVYPVAHPLRLDDTGLKKRLGGTPAVRRKATKPAKFRDIWTAHLYTSQIRWWGMLSSRSCRQNFLAVGLAFCGPINFSG